MATIHDVAKAAGVSIATVSARVNASAPVSPALARRVDEAIARTGYRPDALARSLKTGVTRTIGVLAGDPADPVSAGILAGIAEAAAATGYAVLLSATGRGPDRAETALRLVSGRRPDGVIAVPGVAESRHAWLLDLPKPAVVVGDPPEGADLDAVAPDRAGAAEAATAHLTELGHRRIALVIGQGHAAPGERAVEGYRRALAARDIRFEPRLVRVVGKGGADRQLQAREVLRALLAGAEWPTALVVLDGILAVGMLGAFAPLGLACPGGMSVVALGDADCAAYVVPPLTAVPVPARELGGAAVRLLLDRIAGKSGPEPRRILVPPAPVMRASTAPPPAPA
jgi:LacI family transcriptional regulator